MKPLPISPTPSRHLPPPHPRHSGIDIPSPTCPRSDGAVKGTTRIDQTEPRRTRQLEELYRLIAARADALPKRLRQCADFIARNPDRVAVSTVAELAALADVQPSAMMRFCQELGFKGFSQMQRLFRDEYSRKWPDYATRLENLRASGEQRPGVLLAQFVEAGRASLENLMTTVDADHPRARGRHPRTPRR